MISDLTAKIAALEVVVDKIYDHVDFLSMRKTASLVFGSDSELVGIPWGNMDDVRDGMDSIPKLEAIERLMSSDAVSHQIPHFAKNVIEAFFKEDFQGLGLLGLQARYVIQAVNPSIS